MTDKSEFKQRFESELRELEGRIDKLKANIDKAEGEAKVQYEQTLQNLQETRSEARDKLEELQNASDDRWQELKQDMESTWNDMKSAVQDAVSRETR